MSNILKSFLVGSGGPKVFQGCKSIKKSVLCPFIFIIYVGVPSTIEFISIIK